jgi:hypothetical protein
MAHLEPYITPINVKIETDGNDLILSAYFQGETDSPDSLGGKSSIIFSNNLPASYRIQQANNWYDNSFFIIPQLQWTKMDFDRTSDFESLILSHDDTTLSYNSFYASTYYPQPISVTKGKELTLEIQGPKHDEKRSPHDIRYLTFDDGEDKTQECIEQMDT